MENLGNPATGPDFVQVRAAMVTFAKAGPLEWRKVGGKPAGDVELLLSLPLIQEQLAAFEGDLAADANAAADAVEAAIRGAIDLLPSPYQEAAREQFGFGERELDGAIPDQNDREEHAARKLGRTTHRWYKEPNKEHAGLAPREYVAALVACVLCGISNPTAHVSGMVPSPPKRHEPPITRSPQPARRHPTRIHSGRPVALALGGLLACVAVAAAALGAFAGGTHGPHATRQSGQVHSRQTAPEPLLNSDASCSSLGAAVQEHTGTTEFVDSPGQLGGGENGLVGRITPQGRYGHLLEVKKGDVVDLSIKLHDVEFSPVSDVVVAVGVRHEQPRCARLIAVARSTSAPRDRAELGPLTLKSISDSPPRLRYIPGSTSLLTGSGQQIAHLPDGIMGAGTAVPYQIPPGRTNYFVNFGIKVE
jgi:hypothetical protein